MDGNFVNVGSVTLPINVSVAAWIKTSSSVQKPIFSNRGTGIYFGITGGKFFTYYTTGSPQNMVSVISVNDNGWHHVVWTSNGSVSRMYVDGRLDSRINQSRGAQTGTAYIGWDAPNFNEYFAGDIAQVAVYNNVLSAGDVEQLYAQNAGRFLADRTIK